MKTIIIICVIVLCDSAHDVFLTKAMKEVGEVRVTRCRELFGIVKMVFGNRNFLTAFFFSTIYFFSFLAALSWADLSFVFPANSLVYVTSSLGAKFVLKEEIPLQRWAGIFFICLGVSFTSL